MRSDAGVDASGLKLLRRLFAFAYALDPGAARRAIYCRTVGTSERATIWFAEISTLVADVWCGCGSRERVKSVARELMCARCVVDDNCTPALVLISALSAGPCVARGAVPRRWVSTSGEIHAVGVARSGASWYAAGTQESVLAMARVGAVTGGCPSHAIIRRNLASCCRERAGEEIGTRRVLVKWHRTPTRNVVLAFAFWVVVGRFAAYHVVVRAHPRVARSVCVLEHAHWYEGAVAAWTVRP